MHIELKHITLIENVISRFSNSDKGRVRDRYIASLVCAENSKKGKLSYSEENCFSSLATQIIGSVL